MRNTDRQPTDRPERPTNIIEKSNTNWQLKASKTTMEIDNPVSSGSAMEVEQAVPSSSTAAAAPGSAPAPVSSAAGAAAAAASVTVGGGENAADLKFGPDFEDIHILSNAQVAVILQVSAKSAGNRDEELNEVYRKTQKYVERFNTMTNDEKEHQELVDELDNLQE